jgi:hypothetical protein
LADSQISWRRGDYVRLGKAVSDFNKKINRLNAEENKLYLPETINYKEAKENITTRKELNRLINSLRRFQREGAEEIYTTQAGEELTKWERRELGIQSRIAQTRLRAELKALNEPLESGFSRAQMGSVRVREIEAKIRNLKDIENKKGYELMTLKKRIRLEGASDYSMKRAIVFRENYLNEMKKYSHFDNYEKLISKLESFTNPISFFNFVSQNELTGDLTYQSDEMYSQEAFNSFVQDFGIDIDDDSISLSPREKNLQGLTYSEYKFRKSMKSEKIDNINPENLSSWF